MSRTVAGLCPKPGGNQAVLEADRSYLPKAAPAIEAANAVKGLRQGAAR